VTDLLDNLKTDREQRKELLIIIDEECDRINQLVTEASEIARLESGAVKLDLASYSAGELISAALADCRRTTRCEASKFTASGGFLVGEKGVSSPYH